MKFAMLTTYATPTNMRRELLVSIAGRGHEVTLIAPPHQQDLPAALAEIGGQYVPWQVDRTGLDPAEDARSVVGLQRILRTVRPDVLLIYQIKAVLLGAITAKLTRVKKVVALVNGLGSVFDTAGFGATWKARVARTAYRVALRAVDTIVFQNRDDPETLRKLDILPARTSWSVVAGSGVDLTKFSPAKRAIETPTFTLISRLLVSKGVRTFVEAARAIRARHPDATFVLVGMLEGAGHPDGITREEIQGWEEEGLVSYRGFINDIPGLLARTTAFVLPSYYREGVPRTNLEALAMGCPIVTTDSVGCRDTVEDDVNGFLIQPRDAAALADRLERYLRDPSLAERHGRASRELAARKFDMQLVNRQMMSTLGL